MRIILPSDIEKRFAAALKKAGVRETGGILMGESVSEGVFCVKDLTVQRQPGAIATFVRALQEAVGSLRRFFDVTKHQYRRFNYLGEWHSHPALSVEPSSRDCETMWEIVEDREVGANFAVLIIVRLLDQGSVEASATVYLPGRQVFRATIVGDDGG